MASFDQPINMNVIRGRHGHDDGGRQVRGLRQRFCAQSLRALLLFGQATEAEWF